MALTARIVGPASAEDIVQETFTRAWTQAPNWRRLPSGGDRHLSYAAWLSRVAVNRALDETRRPKTAPIEAAPDLPDPAGDAETRLLTGERAARVRAAVARLPERQRLAMSLVYDGALSNAEAAEVMNTSIGAFELLLVRARRALRAALDDGEAS